MIKFDASKNILEYNYSAYTSKLNLILDGMRNHTLVGSDFLGWNDLLQDYDYGMIDSINNDVNLLKQKAKVMVVIGIGGSYLGSIAVSSALYGQGLNSEFKLLFVGNNMSSDYINEIYEYCLNNDFVINVISKSGTTLEPALSFRIFKELLIKKYGINSLKERLIVTTDSRSGVLREFVDKNDITSYSIPKDVGGRFSVFTAVGLIPLSFVGVNLYELIKGACDASMDFFQDEKYNEAYDYALNRYLQHSSGKMIETLVSYEPAMFYFIEWTKQLFGESEGKDGKGLLPTGMIYSTDLHSLGQFVQDGSKVLFETVFKINKSRNNIIVCQDLDNIDKLNDIVNQDLHTINNKTFQGVINAHANRGNVPNLIVEFERIDEYNMGYLMSFMMYSCTFSAYLLEVNPFNQPGVEVYKEEIYKLL